MHLRFCALLCFRPHIFPAPAFYLRAFLSSNVPKYHSFSVFFLPQHQQRIGHFDVGAVVLALPMEPSKNPFCEHATKVQIDQEQKLLQVRECLLDVLQNYVSIEEHDDDIEVMMIVVAVAAVVVVRSQSDAVR